MTKRFLIFLILLASSASQIKAQTFEVCSSDNLFGVCDENGQIIIPQKYQSLYPCYNYPNLYLVELKNKYGILNFKNELVLPIEYEFDMQFANPFNVDGGQAYFDSTALFILEKNAKFGILSFDFKPVFPFEYDFIDFFGYYNSPNLIAKKGAKYMIVDRTQKKISKNYYTDFANFYTFDQLSGTYAIFKNSNKNWIFVDENGQEFSEALAKTENGKDTIASKIQRVLYNNKYGAIDYKGNLIAEGYDDMSNFVSCSPDNSFLYATISKNKKYGVLRSDGIEIVKPTYDMIDQLYFIGQVAEVALNGKEGIIDLNSGKEVIPPVYDDIWTLGWDNKISYVTNNGKSALVKLDGQLITDFIFEDVQSYQDTLFGARQNGKWGYVNLSGKVIIPFQYDNTMGFYGNDIIPVQKDGKWGYINRQGKAITPFKYDKADYFNKENNAKVIMNEKRGFIDKKGKENWN